MIEKHQYFGAFLLYSDIQAPTYNGRFLSEEMDVQCTPKSRVSMEMCYTIQNGGAICQLKTILSAFA